MRVSFCTFLLICLILSLPSYGVLRELSAPFTTDAKYPFWLGTITTGTLLLYKKETIEPAQHETYENQPLGRYSLIGNMMGQLYPNALYVAGMGIYAMSGKNRMSWNNAGTMFEASLYSLAVTGLLKVTVREPRPNTRKRVSFPSGHSTAAFAFASVVGMRHAWYWGTLAYLMAGGVAYSRMNDNQHWLHDVVAGATIGISYGVGISQINGGRRMRGSIIPIVTKEYQLIAYTTPF